MTPSTVTPRPRILSWCLVLAAAWFAGGGAIAFGQFRPTRRDLPDFDTRTAAAPKAERLAEHQAGQARLLGQVPSVAVDLDPLLDSPKFIRSSGGFLTGPQGEGGAVSAATLKALPENDSLRPIKAFLNEHADLFGHGAEVLDNARVKRDYRDAHNGLRTVAWEQQLDEIPVFQSVLLAHVTRNGELTSISSRFVPALAAAADEGTPGRVALQSKPKVEAADALRLAFKNIGVEVPAEKIKAAGSAGGYLVFKAPGRGLARKVWFPLHRSAVRLAWEVWASDPDTHEGYLLVVDAQTGKVHSRQSITCHISDATYNVYADESPSPFSPSLQSPGTYQPPLTNRTLIVTSALDTNASPAGWIPDGGNTTTGNNIDAFVDRNFDGQPDQPRPQGNPNRVFDFPVDLTQDPTNYIDGVTVQLFWRANWYHDRLYQLGFTEAAGNFQDDNFGRGGLGNDHIICYVQAGADAGWSDNSMFAPSPDGISGECYMFIFDFTNPYRDGSEDSHVVCHEMTHGTSYRLVGGGNMSLSSLQGDGMGEGWSDFYATALLNPAGADPDAAYASGGYVTYKFYGMTQNYYFGIRRYPYCTDMTKNPLTFKDIDPAQALAHTGVPLSPLYAPFDPSMADEVHFQGEVWCVTLWEMHAKLVHKYGWNVGNRLTLQLVTDGMKLTPAAPNFLQARDAILIADTIDNGGANALEIWQAFAKRGMGYSATSPDSSTTAGIHEAFDVPIISTIGVSVVGTNIFGGNGNGIIDRNECNSLNLVLTNHGNVNMTGVKATLSTTTPEVAMAQATVPYLDIPAGAAATNVVAFKISTSPVFVCGTPIELSLVIKCDQGLAYTKITLPTGLPGAPFRFDNNSPVQIPSPGTTNSSVVVSNVNFAVNKVTVSVFAPELIDYYLQLELIAPDGTTNILTANNGYIGSNYGLSCSPDIQRTTFDDDAATAIASGVAPFVGVYKPDQPLSVYIGKSGTNVNGVWQLRATDSGMFDTPSIQCWSLFVTPTLCVDGGGECPGADLALGMTDYPDPIIVGNNLAFTIGVTNNGPSRATNAIVTCILPAGVLFVSAAPSQGTYSVAGGVVTFTLGALGPQGRASMTILGLPTVAGIMFTTATASSEQPDFVPENNSATVVTRVSPATTDLAVTLASAPSPGLVGSPLTYTVSLVNNGPSPASGITVTNALPANATFLSATGSLGSFTVAGNVAFWNLPGLSVGGRASATITVLPTVEGSYKATAMVGGAQFDPILGNNTATVTTVIGPAADVAVGIARYPDPVVAGSNITYIISATNFGPSTATSVTVNDALPAGVSLVSANPSQGSVTATNGTLIWSVGTLSNASKATITVIVATTATGANSSTVTIIAAQADPNPANNTATATTVVTAPFVSIAAASATLTAESFTPTNSAIDIGETVSIILRLRNTGNVSTRNLVATLLTNSNVLPVPPNNSQTYGVVAPSGFPVGRSFSFTATGTNGQTIYATLQLRDGTTNYPSVNFSFTLPSTYISANTNAILIPDPAAPNPPWPLGSGPAGPYPSTINVSNLTGFLGKVTLTLSNFTHSFPGDVNALLVAPGGARALVMSHDGDQGGTNLNLTFDDSVANSLPASGSLGSGTWKPTTNSPAIQLGGFPSNAPAGPYFAAMSTFNGADPNGTWSLYIFDDSQGDTGGIASGWSLALTMTTPVNQIADLGITGAVAPTNCLAGGILTYTFIITNNGPNTATSVAFTNLLPAGVTLVSAAASQGIVLTNTGSVAASLGSLTTGTNATVTVVVVPTAAVFPSGATNGTLVNTATVAADQSDLNPGNSSASVSVTINRPVADPALAQTVVPNPLVVGYNLTNTVVLTNSGPNTALNVVLTQVLPPGAGFVRASSTVGTFTNLAGTFTCTLGDMASNAAATVTIVLTNSFAGLMTNRVTLTTDSSDLNTNNNSATYVTTVVNPAPIIINAGATLTYEGGPVNGAIDPGETVTNSFVLANVGALDTVNLKATLQASGGVTAPGGPQYYGSLIHGGPSTARSFGFKAASGLTGPLIATLQLQDERPGVTNNLGTVTFTFNPPGTSSWSNTAAIIIPDHGISTPYPSSISVSGLAGRVSKATVVLDGFTHTFPHDVSALLVSPSGTNVLIMSHAGGGYSVTNLTLTFDDSAAAPLANNATISTGPAKPSSYQGPVTLPNTVPYSSYRFALSNFNWGVPNGTWSLYVYDDSSGDGGNIARGWSLNLTTLVTTGPVVDLAVGMSSAPASVYSGATLTNTITITNSGPDSATGVVLTNPLPAGVRFVSASLSQGTVYGTNGGLVTCNLGTVPAGGSASVTIVVSPTVVGMLTNTVNVAANEEDLNPANSSVQTTTTIVKANTATALASSVNPSAFGQAVTFSANVTAVLPGTGTPSGTVQFKINGATLGSPVTLSGGSASSTAISSLVVGAYTVTADYSGDASFNTNSGTLGGGQVVKKSSSATTLGSSVNPSVFGQTVTFSATVAAVAPGVGMPTGTVQFKINGANLGSAVALSAGGVATSPSISSLVVGSYTITANYSGDGSFSTSSGTLAGVQTVNEANTSTALRSLVNPAVFGQPVTFSATVTAVAPGTGIPTGTVQFKINGANLGSAVALSGGSAGSPVISSLAVGTYTVTAEYSGDSGFTGSSDGLFGGQVVNKAGSSTAVTSTANPSVFGQLGTFNATVSAVSPGAGVPTGTVQFKTNGVNFGSAVALSGGSASSASISSLAVGSYAVTADYSGDSGFNISSGALVGGLAVTNPVPAILSGSLSNGQFRVKGTAQPGLTYVVLGSANLISWSSLGTVTASAGGTFDFIDTTAPTARIRFYRTELASSQTVNKADSSMALSSSPNPSVFGQSVTFTATLTAVSPGAGVPAGTVQFKTNGVNFGSAVALSSGSASSAAISSLAVGSYAVTAVYSGDGSFNATTNTLSGGQVVNKAGSSTAAASSVNPSVFGQSVSFTATLAAVAPGAGVPSGTVQFKLNGVNFGSAVALSGGSASSAAISSLAVGSHTVTAEYSGDGSFNASTNSLSGGQVVNKAGSATAVTSSVNPSVFGQPGTFNAVLTAVAPGAGVPTGTVQFKLNGVNFGSAVALSGGSASSATIASLAVGSYMVTAEYSGDGSFNASTNTLSTGQVVNKAGSSTAVISSANPSVFGQLGAFNATLTAVAPGAGVPSGTVQFKTNGVDFGSAVALSGGSASSATIASLAVGSYTVTVEYSGDISFNASTNTLSGGQVVNKATSSTAVASSVNPSVFGQPGTFNATLAAVAPGAGVPSGTVQFKTNGVPFGAAVALSGGSASSATIASLAVGSYTVTAEYSGDGSFHASTNTLSGGQVVNKAGSSTAVISSAHPSVFGQSVAFTATLTAVAPGVGVPSGTVQFKTNGVNFGSAVALSGGSASSPAISSLAVGTYTVTAEYSGDGSFDTSTNTLSGGQVVNKAGSSTAVASSVNPSMLGQPVTFTAALTAVAPGAGVPSGTVQFKTNGVNFGSAVALSSGSASSAAISSLAAGTYTVGAEYSGDGSFHASTNTLSGGQVVNNPVPARLSGAMVAGHFQLTVTAQPTLSYEVQASTNFAGWVSLITNTVPAGGFFTYTDTNAPPIHPRFYRTLLQAP